MVTFFLPVTSELSAICECSLIPTYEKVQSTSLHYPTGILLSYLHTDCLLWKLLELELFCSREEENGWHRAQLLQGRGYYANSPRSSHFSKAFFSPFNTHKTDC